MSLERVEATLVVISDLRQFMEYKLQSRNLEALGVVFSFNNNKQKSLFWGIARNIGQMLSNVTLVLKIASLKSVRWFLEFGTKRSQKDN